MGNKPLSALGVAMPADIEQSALAFMRVGVRAPGCGTGLFNAKTLQVGILEEMHRRGISIDDLTANWPRRIVDALIRREAKAGNIEKYGPGGPASFWHWRRGASGRFQGACAP